MKGYNFSLASRINVNISGNMSKKCFQFIKLIYQNFDESLKSPTFVLNVILTDTTPHMQNPTILGKDCQGNQNTIVFNTGHWIKKTTKGYDLGVPTKVKRGRIPFKRVTSGRHLTDELIEPMVQILLLESNATFIHASSVFSEKKVNVYMGWRGTGKTNIILNLLGEQEIWSDDLSIVDADGYVYPYPRPIRIYRYNLPLIRKEYRSKHFLDFKKYVTPPWQPVHYLPLKAISGETRGRLNQLNYINRSERETLTQSAEDIMDFEQLFFEDYKIIMRHLGMLKEKNTIQQVIETAINSL